MSLEITGQSSLIYNFEGPYDDTDDLQDRSGVYVIVCEENSENIPIDVGESSKVKSRIESHDRKECWIQNCEGDLVVYVYYTPNQTKKSRMEIEQDIREKYNFPCGKI